MSRSTANLRFLLSLGTTKMVILQDEENLRVYSRTGKDATVVAEHVAEAVAGK